LAAEDKAEVIEALRLKTQEGDRVWPGFAEAQIPIILFNAQFEFLIGEFHPGRPWEAVAGDDFQGHPLFRRVAKDSQNFAVKVGSRWAGSAGTLAHMNSKNPFKLSPDFHIVVILHEMLHAFQSDHAPKRLARALDVYRVESRYPFQDKEFAAAWAEEGATLAGALKAADADSVRLAQKFLEIRDARRSRAGFDSTLLGYERELEWLEGLAEYAEIQFYELAASRPAQASSVRFAPGLHPFLRWDFVRLEKQLAAQGGELRFYLTGMAQARLLDRLSPGWKTKVPLGDVYLEDLLRAAVQSRFS
jgi:hypothetical protein